MHRRTPTLVLGAALVLGVQGTARAQALDPEATFRAGVAAVKAGQIAEAREAFAKAFAVRKSHDVAANLGFAEAKMGRWVDAAGHLSYARRRWPVDRDPAALDSVVQWLGDAQRRVTRLEITSIAEGARVVLDGALIGYMPIADDVYVEAGATHTLEATAPGMTAVRKELRGSAGAVVPVELQFQPASAITPAPLAPVAPAPMPPPRPSVMHIGVAGGAAVLLSAVGIGLTLAANHSAAELATTQARLGAFDACGGPAPLRDCSLVVSAAGQRRMLTIGAGTSFAFAGAGAAVAAVLAAWRWTPPVRASQSADGLTFHW